MHSNAALPFADIVARKLATHTIIGGADRQALLNLPHRLRSVAARQDIISLGETTEACAVLLEGIAGRTLQLDDGQRQFVGFNFRGEWLDDTAALDAPASYAVCALSNAVVALVPKDALAAMVAKHPQLALGLWREAVIESAILRQANLNLGLRSKSAALAHLFCELHVRAHFAGLCSNGSCDIPLTQSELASALGMSLITLNRTLQAVRRTKAVEFRNGRLTVLNFRNLADTASFEPRYLHLPAK